MPGPLASFTTLVEQIDGVTSIVSYVVVSFAGIALARWWVKAADRAQLFTRYHATAGARTIDAASWALWHGLRWSGKRGAAVPDRPTHKRRFWACIAVLALMVLLPVLGVLLNDADLLKQHGFAFGFAALVAGLAVEWPAQRMRDAQYATMGQGPQPTRDPTPANVNHAAVVRVVGLIVLDLAAYILLVTHAASGAWAAAVFGAALVGVADIAAVIVTLVIGAAEGRPFRIP